ncbi:hypothetical protein [Thermomonas sp.]|uniref:hypothetical protein n=1 Tax=Thermomonas sp. TaxID=1971895 RepID=UPI0035B2CE64
MQPPCPMCTCTLEHPAHALLAALRDDDLDAALTLGLLEAQPCPCCVPECNRLLAAARDARRLALAARQRHHARAARLARIKAEREAARHPAPAPASAPTAQQATPALPTAAADALARALAKAKARHA